MLKQLAQIIEKRPWLVVGIIFMITIGFSSTLPFLEMGTSMDDFTPDDEIVKASQRVTEYFGGSQQMLMIYVKNQKAKNVVTPEALKEEYLVAKDLEKLDETGSSISIAGFVDIICQMEFGKTLINCSNEEISRAYEDLLTEIDHEEIQMMETDDPNEETDYNKYPRVSKGKKIDSMDVKNYYIKEDGEKICFSIEVYDLSHFESKLTPPLLIMNVMEWYIDFKNQVIPDEMLDIDYKITAHVEPKHELWQIGRGISENLKNILYNINNKELFKSYKKEAYLWISMPGEDMSFPILLETGNVTFNIKENRVEIEVTKEELGKYGISPEMYGVGLPARLGNSKAGTRLYPWLRINFDINFIQDLIKGMQNKPVLNNIFTKITSRFSDFSWEDFDEMFEMMEDSGFAIETMSLKDLGEGWTIVDESPDVDFSDETFFIKPLFMEELKNSTVAFLSEDYLDESGPSATLIMIPINENFSMMGSGDVSKLLVQKLEEYDQEKNYVTMEATGDGVISYQIDELANEANTIIMPSIFITICIILFLNFRKISYMILPMVGLSISVIWVFGTMVLLGMKFNAMSVAIVPLLMGLGVDYSVHIFHNYRAELAKGKTPGESIVSAIQDIGTAMFLAAITTVIAFLSFLTASIPPIRDMGILCALGIIYIFIVTITLQAAVRYIIDRKADNSGKLKSRRDPNGKTMKKTSDIVYKHPRVILLVACIITLIFFGGALNVQTAFNIEDFLPEDNPSMELTVEIGKEFPFSSQDQEQILIEGDVATVDLLKGIYKTYGNIKDDKYALINVDGTPKTISILSIIQDAMKGNKTLITKFNLDRNGIPQSDRDVKSLYDYLYEDNNYKIEVEAVLNKTGNSYDATVIRIYLDFSSHGALDMNEAMGRVHDDLNEDLVDYGDADAIVTGASSSIYIITNSLTESQIISTFISIILAAIVLMIVYKNPLLGLITMLPVGISIVWILGSMHFIGYSLNVMTVMVTSLTIGIGIDYAIHTTERFRLIADKTGDVTKAVLETIGHTGGALLIAAMSTIAGFGMLILAPIPPEQQFGVIMCLTILYAFLTSIFILPPIVMKWAKWRKKRKGYIISPGNPKDRK